MVHQFMQLNAATIKYNYPMRRMEPILNMVTKPGWAMFMKADAANGYWAVPLAPEHAYKPAFVTALGQYCYLRMGQGLSGAPGTYARLKDLFAGPIPKPHPEPSLRDHPNIGFDCFVDDDMGAARSARDMIDFLHNHYFPRLAWANLTLNPKKTCFGTDRARILGHECSLTGMRPSVDKREVLLAMPEPKDENDLLRFCFMLPFLKAYIPFCNLHLPQFMACRLDIPEHRMTNPERWNSECHKLGQFGSIGSLQFGIFQTNDRELDLIDTPSANTRFRKSQALITEKKCKATKYDLANREVSQPRDYRRVFRRISNPNCLEGNENAHSGVLVQSTFYSSNQHSFSCCMPYA